MADGQTSASGHRGLAAALLYPSHEHDDCRDEELPGYPSCRDPGTTGQTDRELRMRVTRPSGSWPEIGDRLYRQIELLIVDAREEWARMDFEGDSARCDTRAARARAGSRESRIDPSSAPGATQSARPWSPRTRRSCRWRRSQCPLRLDPPRAQRHRPQNGGPRPPPARPEEDAIR